MMVQTDFFSPGDTERPSRQTPQNIEDNRVSERQKAQMSKLESDCEKVSTLVGIVVFSVCPLCCKNFYFNLFMQMFQLQKELDQMSEKLQKSEAELKAARVSKEKAEQLLECHQVRNQVERENAEERHLETIKVKGTLI